MGRIPEDTIQTIRDRVDIVDLVGRHVTLKRAGRTWKGLCPFHQEKTPSFIVSPDRGTFHCFGCGEGGNAFAFLMRHENLTFPEAARSLAAELGIEIPESSRESDGGLSEKVLEACRLAASVYERALWSPEGEGARSYLTARGLDEDWIRKLGIGFAPDRWDTLTEEFRSAGVDPKMGERAGLLRERERGGHYDMLRGRLIFPIQDARGRVVAFGGRALGADQEPKYLNTPESPVFRKRESFYGLPHALEAIRKSDRVVISEGYFDRIALARAGVEESLATCGTALTEDHTRNLRRRTQHVVLLFDGDEAGQRAMLRALDVLLPSGLRVSAAKLPPGQDPDDVLLAEGADALSRLVDAAQPAVEVAIRRAVSAGCSTPWERADAVAAVVPLLAAIPDPVERSEFGRRLALAAGAEPADVMAAIRRQARDQEPAEEAPLAPRRLSADERHFAEVLRILIDQPELTKQLRQGEFEACAPDEGWARFAASIHEALSAGHNTDWLADQLEGADRARLTALAAEPATRPRRSGTRIASRARYACEARVPASPCREPGADPPPAPTARIPWPSSRRNRSRSNAAAGRRERRRASTRTRRAPLAPNAQEHPPHALHGSAPTRPAPRARNVERRDRACAFQG